mgnify:CR=1 FL=1
MIFQMIFLRKANITNFSEVQDLFDKVVEVNQQQIGKTPRSNPATYTGVYSEIRKLFSDTIESKIRGYKPGRFSFNVSGGRCENCKGGGMKLIEMSMTFNVFPDFFYLIIFYLRKFGA